MLLFFNLFSFPKEESARCQKLDVGWIGVDGSECRLVGSARLDRDSIDGNFAGYPNRPDHPTIPTIPTVPKETLIEPKEPKKPSSRPFIHDVDPG